MDTHLGEILDTFGVVRDVVGTGADRDRLPRRRFRCASGMSAPVGGGVLIGSLGGSGARRAEIPEGLLRVDAVGDRPMRQNGFLVRLIATDLDGTLLRSDRETVSPRTRSSRSGSRAGNHDCAGQRSCPVGVADVAHAAGCDGLAICSNGGVVLDLASREVVRHRPLAAEVAAQMIQALRAQLPGVCFATETESVFAVEPAFEGAWEWKPPAGTRYGDALELVASPVTKLIARDATCSIAELAAAARHIAAENGSVAVSGEWVIEISAAGVNKAATLKEVAADLGVDPADVVAFGDYPNDLPMLAWAGRSIAPANAHPDVLAKVDEVTDSNDDDGLALVVERLLGRGDVGDDTSGQ